MSNHGKLLRIIDMSNFVKNQRDKFHDEKRMSEARIILKNLSYIRNLSKETYRIAKKNQLELKNLRKAVDAIQETMGMDFLNEKICQKGLEPIPEEEELAEMADEVEVHEVDNLLDISEESLIIDEETMNEEVYGNITNPDSSIEVDQVLPLTEEQKLRRDRRIQIQKEMDEHDFHGIDDKPYSFESYLKLNKKIQKGFSPTPIAPPNKPQTFLKRYKHPWTPDMNVHAAFGGTRAKARIQKPLGWKKRVLAEREQNQDDNANDAKTKTRRFVQEANEADDASNDDLFNSTDDEEDSDFEVKVEVVPQQQDNKRKNSEPIAGPAPKKPKANPAPKAPNKTKASKLTKKKWFSFDTWIRFFSTFSREFSHL